MHSASGFPWAGSPVSVVWSDRWPPARYRAAEAVRPGARLEAQAFAVRHPLTGYPMKFAKSNFDADLHADRPAPVSIKNLSSSMVTCCSNSLR